jgi:Asp/Glu/hydantoin racemase
LGGAGLAGYARLLQAHCSLPLIDSVVSGWHLMLHQQAPPATTEHNGFHAQWHGMPRSFMAQSVHL